MEAGQNEHLQMAHKLLGLFPRETLNRQHFGLWPNKPSSHTTPHSIQPPYDTSMDHRVDCFVAGYPKQTHHFPAKSPSQHSSASICQAGDHVCDHPLIQQLMHQLLIVAAPLLGPVQLREVALGVCHGKKRRMEGVGGWLMCQVYVGNVLLIRK